LKNRGSESLFPLFPLFPLLIDSAPEAGFEDEQEFFIRSEKDSNLADPQSVFVRIGGEWLDVQMMDVPPDQAGDGFFDAKPELCGKTLNELVRFATDLESAFCMNIYQFLMASWRFSVLPRFSSA